mgnify:CR=1 FL=1
MLISLFHSLKETFIFTKINFVVFLIFTLLLTSLFSSKGLANETTSGPEIDLIGQMSVAAVQDGLNVTDQLHCIADLSEKNSPFRRPLALQNFLLLAPHLKKKFETHQVGPLQRALFYSQIIHESQQFSRLSEVSGSGMNHCWNKLSQQPGNACSNSVTCEILDDLAFREQKPYLEKFRGRGLIHLTGCDTYISALHFHNTGKWRAYWPVDSKPPSNCPSNRCPQGQIGMDCSPENIAEIKTWYRSKYNKELDSVGVLANPSLLSKTCDTVDPRMENKANDFIVDSTFAFWKGKCQNHTPKIQEALKILTRLGPIQGMNKANATTRTNQLKGNEQLKSALRIVSVCVNGGTNGLADREKWFLRALQCVHQ